MNIWRMLGAGSCHLSLSPKVVCIQNLGTTWWDSDWEHQPQATIPTCTRFLSPPKVFQPQNPNHSSHISSRIGPEHCLLVNKCGACLDRRSTHTGLWIKHVALIKNNLAQKCQRPLRSITPLPSIPSLQLTGFKERGPWLALATSTECLHILYDPVVNVLSGIK